MSKKGGASPRRSGQSAPKAETPSVLTRRIGRDGQVIPWGPKVERKEPDRVPDPIGVEVEGQPMEGEWELRLVFTEVGGRLYPSRLVLEEGMFAQGPPPGGITARLLHGIKLGALVDEFRQEQKDDRAAEALFFSRHLKPSYELPPPTNRPGPKGLDEVVYQDIAVRYVEALRSNPRAPLVAMLPHYPHRSKANVRDWVARTRYKGYLMGTRKGVSGGEPTEKLLEALRARGAPLPKVAAKRKPRSKPERGNTRDDEFQGKKPGR